MPVSRSLMPRSDKLAMRRQVILDDLRRHPWSKASAISDRILDETGGPPTIATGALWIPSWTVYSDLRYLEDAGRVERRQMTKRTVLWAVVE